MHHLLSRLGAGLRRVVNFLNFPRHIRNYYLRKKISQHTDQKEPEVEYSRPLVIVLVIVGLLLVGYLNWVYKEVWLLVTSLFVIGVASLGVVIRRTKDWEAEEDYQGITEVILKDQEGNNLQRWSINNRTSCLIGKQTANNEVDIDLSQATYSSLISRQHAVLNNTGDKWYFADTDSYNGSGLRKKDSEQKFKVESGKPYQLNSGDTIYIANTKLVVR